MQKIDELRQEIKAFEVEITKLQAELLAASQIAPPMQSNSPEAIANAFRSAAVVTHERIADVQGIRNAIAELTARLAQKKSQFEELEVQQLKQLREKRIEEGKQKLRAKFGDVEKMAEALEGLYFGLKAIALEYEKDFAQIHPPTSGGTALNRNSLLNIEPLTIPHFVEEKDRFVLSNKFFDLFEAEKEALQRQRIEASIRSQQNHQDLLAQIKQRELDKQRALEQQERAAFIAQKQEQLQTMKSQRGWDMRGQAATNFHPLHDAIASLEAEIENLEKPVQT
ncbi:hypothetical protein [Synechocystis sp. PCC 7509]|uniref:hypothetical protein n=1 Tax=Synechocystis sp. PCC 7509 TaxID=927677 RepID=UPI0002ABE4A3|nr:hypothetical protein [Synechocystis sp. PCC 7509]